jgi:hypothetical protein
MTSQPIRDPLADHLITPQNATLVLIDYQPSQFATVLDTGIAASDVVFAGESDRRHALEAHRAGLERVVQAGAQRSAGCRLPANYSATGLASKQSRPSSKSS